jgi:GalNAc-alpha-(1->4)-GalNAc-alpha-(1->3)-diNAcBac-PP-undecaprenol alpha-1,4-N-acetyl-D-galactosaminyltransferase
MKIVFLVGKLSYGGGEKITVCLSRTFSEIGHDIYFYTWNKKLLEKSESKPSFIKEIRLLVHQGIGVKGKILSVLELKKALISDKIDIVISFGIAVSEMSTVAGILADVPVIISERIDPISLPEVKIHRLLRPFFYALASGKVFQTDRVLKYYPKFVQKGSCVIPNPIMHKDLPDPILDQTLKRKEIIAVGRLSPEKRFDLLIRSFQRVSKKHPEFNLNIYGEGELYHDLEKQIEECGLIGKVVLHGKVEDILEQINGAEIFVMASEYEGMPNALIEAMAMGLACVSTNFPTGGAEVLIQSGINGILIPVGDVDAMSDALIRLIENDGLRISISREATNIRKTNSLESISGKWINYIRSIIDHRS